MRVVLVVTWIVSCKYAASGTRGHQKPRLGRRLTKVEVVVLRIADYEQQDDGVDDGYGFVSL